MKKVVVLYAKPVSTELFWKKFYSLGLANVAGCKTP